MLLWYVIRKINLINLMLFKKVLIGFFYIYVCVSNSVIQEFLEVAIMYLMLVILTENGIVTMTVVVR